MIFLTYEPSYDSSDSIYYRISFRKIYTNNYYPSFSYNSKGREKPTQLKT